LDENGGTVGYAVLDNFSERRDHLSNYFLELLANSFLLFAPSNKVVPSIFNATAPVGGYFEEPVRNLPRIDEIILHSMYKKETNQKISEDEFLRELSSAIEEKIMIKNKIEMNI